MSANKKLKKGEKPTAKIYLQKDVDNITSKVRKTAEKQLFESKDYQSFLKWKTLKQKYVEQLIFLRKERDFLAEEIKKCQDLVIFLEDKSIIMDFLIKENIQLKALDFIMTQINEEEPLLEEVKRVVEKHTYLKQKPTFPKQIILNIDNSQEM